MRSRDTKTHLLDSALEVFERGGHAGFTVHAVTARSGSSLGSLYHHFGSMDGLAAGLYIRCMSALLDAVAAPLARVRTARAGILAATRAYLAFTARQRTMALFIHGSAYQAFLPAHAPAIARAKAPRLEAILAWVRPHVRSGAIVTLSEPMFEALVIGPVAEVSRRHLAGVPGFALDEAAKVLPERIWHAVRGRAMRR